MTITTGSMDTEETDALNEDAPLVLANNVLTGISTPTSNSSCRWTDQASGHFGSADTTDSQYPCSNAFDGRLTEKTQGNSSSSSHNLLFDLGGTTGVIDTVIIKPTVMGLTWDNVYLDLDDQSDFSTAVTAASWTDASGSTRLVSVMGNRYSDVRYIRIRFEDTASSTSPGIGEVILGRRRQLSYKFLQGADTDMSSTEYTDLIAQSGDITRHVWHRDRLDKSGTLLVTTQSRLGLDDISTVRSIWDDCRHGLDPVAYIEDPSSAPTVAPIGRLMVKERKLKYGGSSDAEWDFEFRELPEFLGRET